METVTVDKFRALLVTKDGKRLSVADLMDGDIPVRVDDVLSSLEDVPSVATEILAGTRGRIVIDL